MPHRLSCWQGGPAHRGSGEAEFPRLCSKSVELCACCMRRRYSGRKLLPSFSLVDMTGAPHGVILLLGHHVGAPSLLNGFLWVKILYSSWMCDG